MRGRLDLLSSTAGDGRRQPAARRSVANDPGQLVESLRSQGIRDTAVLAAMAKVRRHRFVDIAHAGEAYGDHPLPIGHGQTISQPYIVALMTELIAPRRGLRVLEIGTGSGYQAAILDSIGCEVWSVEILPALAAAATQTLRRLGHQRVRVRTADGHAGWPEFAPFDAILVTAAPEDIPEPLCEQLGPGGRLVVPVGPQGSGQDLLLVDRAPDGSMSRRAVIPVRFVPLVRPRWT